MHARSPLYAATATLLLLSFFEAPSLMTAAADTSPVAGGLEVAHNRAGSIRFERNDGQLDSQVTFSVRTASGTLFLTDTGSVATLEGRRSEAEAPQGRAAVSMNFGGASAAAAVSGEGELPGRSNYFIGNDPARWRTDVPSFARIRYSQVYAGIDVVYYANASGEVEYDLVVAPGADTRAIRLEFEGADLLDVDASGDLVVHTALGEVRHRSPVAYQETASGRLRVVARYQLSDDRTATLDMGAYDAGIPLVVDPVIAYSTYLGGSGYDGGGHVAVDGSGSAYVSGYTESSDFPTTRGYDRSYNGIGDVFITKLSPAGNALIYSTYLGGTTLDYGGAIAVDATGAAYVTGTTFSEDFPTVNAIPSTIHADHEPFVAKLDPTGHTLLYSTYLAAYGEGGAIAVDGSGNASVCGDTSGRFPVTVGAFDGTVGGGDDVFVATISASGSTLLYATYFGGTGDEFPGGFSVDATGAIYVSGTTNSTDFPTRNAAFPVFGGERDAFVAKFNPAATGDASLIYSTYLGGSDIDFGGGVAVDDSGSARLVGSTRSSDLPVKNAFDASFNGGDSDAFLAELSPDGSALVYCTYLGGSRDDGGASITVDASGASYVTAYTKSRDFPTMNPVSPAFPGESGDAAVLKLTAAGDVTFSTHLGGSENDAVGGIVIDSSQAMYVAGYTESRNFPVTPNAFDRDFGGAAEGFVTKIEIEPVVTAVQGITSGGKPFKLKITGQNLQPGIHVFIGGDTEPWPMQKLKGTTTLTLKKGAPLEAKFPAGVAVEIRLVNPDGGQATTSFTR